MNTIGIALISFGIGNNLYLNDKLIIAGDMFDFFVGVDRNSRFQQRIRQIILKGHPS